MNRSPRGLKAKYYIAKKDRVKRTDYVKLYGMSVEGIIKRLGGGWNATKIEYAHTQGWLGKLIKKGRHETAQSLKS